MNRNVLMAGEILLVIALIAGDYYGIVPISSTPFFVALGWASLRLRGLRWRDVGLVRPPNFSRARYVMNLFAAALPRAESRWLVSLLATSVLFGLGHGNQGIIGIAQETLSGLAGRRRDGAQERTVSTRPFSRRTTPCRSLSLSGYWP